MYKWVVLILILPVLWGGYWFFGSFGLKSEIETWLTERRSEGWQVEYSDLNVRGFPNRFDTTLTDVQLTDPDTGISWTAPFFQLLALSYKPNHVIAVWPDRQTLATPYQSIAITSDDMKASLVTSVSSDLELERGTVVSNGINLSSQAGWSLGIGNITASIRQLPKPNSYEISSESQSLTPSSDLLQWLGTDHNLPAKVEGFSFNIKTELTDTIGLKTLEVARPQIRELEITRMRASWGELLIRGTGRVQVDQTGQLDGELQLNAKNWREMLAMAVSVGAISQDIAGAAEIGLSFIARLSGSESSLDTTLAFRQGRIFLGPVPIGTAPRLIIR